MTFPKDFRISGCHATLRLAACGKRATIMDTSVNGTFVNGERVERDTERVLAEGDNIFLVVPDPRLLQPVYSGSLIDNFVGYRVHYATAAGGMVTTTISMAPGVLSRGRSPSLGPGAGDVASSAPGAGGDRWPSQAKRLIPTSHVFAAATTSSGTSVLAATAKTAESGKAKATATKGIQPNPEAQLYKTRVEGEAPFSFAMWCLSHPAILSQTR
jgi:hypothetical protein